MYLYQQYVRSWEKHWQHKLWNWSKGKEGLWRRAPSPSQHQSTASPSACCARLSTASLSDIVSLLIHILSVFHTNIQPTAAGTALQRVQCPGFTSHTFGCRVLSVPAQLLCCSLQVPWQGIHSPAKLQGSAGGLQKHQASKQNLQNSHHLCTDKILNRASDKYRCKGVGRGKWDNFVHSFTAEQRDGTSFSQAYELSEVKNESAGNRIRGQMNVFPLNWDTLMALTLAKYFFHLSLTFHQKCGKKYSKCSRNALKNQFKILPQKILNSACPHISSHCPITGFNLNTVLQ